MKPVIQRLRSCSELVIETKSNVCRAGILVRKRGRCYRYKMENVFLSRMSGESFKIVVLCSNFFWC
uniref:Uncharacterized protein n=1 Tax=Rhizophora mucronata TaxID=61149 RepID=A0A2P2PVD7_RHIMU